MKVFYKILLKASLKKSKMLLALQASECKCHTQPALPARQTHTDRHDVSHVVRSRGVTTADKWTVKRRGPQSAPWWWVVHASSSLVFIVTSLALNGDGESHNCRRKSSWCCIVDTGLLQFVELRSLLIVGKGRYWWCYIVNTDGNRFWQVRVLRWAWRRTEE